MSGAILSRLSREKQEQKANIGQIRAAASETWNPISNSGGSPIVLVQPECDAASMTIAARLKIGETLGDRVIKVDHAGEHGAICIYMAQRRVARWRAPDMVAELDAFLEHERTHRARFGAELKARGLRRCRSCHFCGVGGLLLGAITGLLGRNAIAATTVAIERVVLRHLDEQASELDLIDPAAANAIRQIIEDERNDHNLSSAQLRSGSWWARIIGPVVSASTESVIWLGMRL